MTTQQRIASVTIDATTQIVAKPAKQGWTVLAVENGQERPLGQSTVLGARRAIHEVLQQRNRAIARRPAGRNRSQRPGGPATGARRSTPVTPLTPPTTAPENQTAAWAALRHAVAQSRKTAPKPAQPATPPKRAHARRPVAAQATTTPATPTAAVPATPAPEPTPAPAPARTVVAGTGAAWGVHVTLERVADDTTTTPATGTAVGEIAPAMSRALRDALGDRTGGRVRKALRRHGLINRPTVLEHELTTRGRTQRLRIHVTPLDETATGNPAAAILDRTQGLPVHRDIALLGA